MDLRRNSSKPARADVNEEESLEAYAAWCVVATQIYSIDSYKSVFFVRDLLKRKLPMFIELKGPLPELLFTLKKGADKFWLLPNSFLTLLHFCTSDSSQRRVY